MLGCDDAGNIYLAVVMIFLNIQNQKVLIEKGDFLRNEHFEAMSVY